MSVRSRSTRDVPSGRVPRLRLAAPPPDPPDPPDPPAPDATQPRPIGVLLCVLPCGTTQSTAIARAWAPGDPARCRLCPSCSVDANNVCLVVAPGRVPDSDAALFALHGAAKSGGRVPARRDQGARSS
jgi:hypothetical protein